MAEVRPATKMPELLVFAKSLIAGLIAAEIFRLAFYAGQNFARQLSDIEWWIRAIAITFTLLVCITYAVHREAIKSTARLGRSLRIDLLAIALLGIWADQLISPWLGRIHKLVRSSDPYWAPTLLGVLLLMMSSALWRTYWPRKRGAPPQLYFLTDEGIATEDEDVLTSADDAQNFAETVLASKSHTGLVFGIDGPWGTGKTSFLNLAERYWNRVAAESVIVFRFEPLRYASDPDLTDRFIRDLSSTIQRQVFVPEFRPAVSRYSRMLKGKADFSILGLKLSFDPSSETVDELLDDIDDVLKRIGRRVIIVVDDLDRLEAKSVNNVLFTARRTFKLSQAAYILCYDTENLVRDEGEKAREFLEKFVTIKLSLFVDSSTLRNFLLRDWKRDEGKLQSIPSDTMLKLSSVLSELADILGDKGAASYGPLLGDLRKLKRFVNATLLMQIEKTDLGRTDFHRRDLVHLILLHLSYPGLFRRIYAEETEGRAGIFSVIRHATSGTSTFSNSEEFGRLIGKYEGPAQFLLKQLFDVEVLGIKDVSATDELVLRSRACFNSEPHRNLEKYLRLIVRFAIPQPRETFKLYQDSVQRIVQGRASIASILEEPEYQLRHGELAHDQFWRVLVSQSYEFTQSLAEESINTLVDYLPRYSSIDADGRGLRSRSIYSLIRLLDRAGWGRTHGRRLPNTAKNVVEIAHRIFGEAAYAGKGLIQRLATRDRGHWAGAT